MLVATEDGLKWMNKFEWAEYEVELLTRKLAEAKKHLKELQGENRNPSR